MRIVYNLRMSSPETNRRTVSEDVYRALKRDVLMLVHEPGSPLREVELAERYGSSRVPVREACRRLQQEGLIDSVPYKGYFANRISVKEIADSFELRTVLEVEAVMLAVERADEESIAALEDLAHVEYRHEDWPSYAEFLAKNREYHLAVARMAGNEQLYLVLRDLIERMQRFFFLGLDLGDFGAEMRQEHEQLTAALKARDGEEAARCVREQIESSRERIIKALFKQRIDLAVD
jgi:DNA-binding GntR family transcriptional regulator